MIAFVLSAVFFYKQMIHPDPASIKYGIFVGFILFSGYGIQTIGLQFTSTTNSAFITGLSVVMVPLFSAVLFKTRIKNAEKMGVVVALTGLIILTLRGVEGFNLGDFYTLLGSFCFAFHIITVGHFTNRTNSIQFAITQIGAVGFFSLIMSLIFETPSLAYPVMTWLNMLFLAVFCTSAAFITQSIAQRYTTSTHTALIYINEPVFAAIFGYFVAGEILGVRGLIGGLLMLSGILIAELGADIGKRLKNA